MEKHQLQRKANGETVTLVTKEPHIITRKELLKTNEYTLIIPKGVILTRSEKEFIEENTEFTLA